MNSEHLEASRGWALIRDRGTFTPGEIEHLKGCSQCHDWFTTFVANARSAGFVIAFSIPAFEAVPEREGEGSLRAAAGIVMTSEHLNPNRGWTLIRDGGHFSPDEIRHLEECEACSEWLTLFADLARGAGFRPEFRLPFSFLAEDHHLTAGRAWNLIRDRGQFTLPEIGHLHYCKVCHQWLSKFVATARAAGFEIAFEIPPCDCPRE